MKILKKILVFYSLILSGNDIFSQKFFSESLTTPVIINPANTGDFLGTHRIGGVYRNDVNSFFTNSTGFFSIETKLNKLLNSEKDKLAIGLSFLSEKIRFLGAKNSNLYFSVAYFKSLDEDGLHNLSIGFQTNFANRKVEPPNWVFPSQMIQLLNFGYTAIEFRNGRAINLNYVDFNTGILYRGIINQKIALFTGIAVLHANKPYKAFDGGNFSLSPEISLQAGVECRISTKSKVSTIFNLMRNVDTRITSYYTLGSVYQHIINASKYKIHGGLYLCNNKTYGYILAPATGLSYNNFDLTITYPFSINSNVSTPKFGLEISLIHNGKRTIQPK